jgi:hypothetical protein
MKGTTMFECKGLVGKVIEEAAIHADSNFGPEFSLTFTDGTVFSFSVSNRPPIEAKLTRDEGGQPVVLHDYSMAGDSY